MSLPSLTNAREWSPWRLEEESVSLFPTIFTVCMILLEMSRATRLKIPHFFNELPCQILSDSDFRVALAFQGDLTQNMTRLMDL